MLNEILSEEQLDDVNGGGASSWIRAIGGCALAGVAIAASIVTVNPGLAVAGGAAFITGVSGIADVAEGK